MRPPPAEVLPGPGGRAHGSLFVCQAKTPAALAPLAFLPHAAGRAAPFPFDGSPPAGKPCAFSPFLLPLCLPQNAGVSTFKRHPLLRFTQGRLQEPAPVFSKIPFGGSP